MLQVNIRTGLSFKWLIFRVYIYINLSCICIYILFTQCQMANFAHRVYLMTHMSNSYFLSFRGVNRCRLLKKRCVEICLLATSEVDIQRPKSTALYTNLSCLLKGHHCCLWYRRYEIQESWVDSKYWFNKRNGVSNHRCLDCLSNRLFRRRSK